MNNKLSEEDKKDVIIQSLALSVALIEKFELMTDNGLVVHKTKQSLKATCSLLQIYVDRIFDDSDKDEYTKKGLKKGASHLTELSNRIERSLATKNLLDISQRKADLKAMIDKTVLFDVQKVELYEKIRDSGILDY